MNKKEWKEYYRKLRKTHQIANPYIDPSTPCGTDDMILEGAQHRAMFHLQRCIVEKTLTPLPVFALPANTALLAIVHYFVVLKITLSLNIKTVHLPVREHHQLIAWAFFDDRTQGNGNAQF